MSVAKVESFSVFTTFSNPLFDDNDDLTSSDDESLSKEEVPIEELKVYSNPLFDDEEINSDKIDPHQFNCESEFVESLSNRDTLIESSMKFDHLEEFSGALMPIRIAEEERIWREHADYISLEDSDSLMDKIDLFLATDELLPPNIKSDGYDSEGDIHFLEELLVDDCISISENEASDFDHDNPSFLRPPLEPPDVEFLFDLEPEVISAVMNNNNELNEDNCFDACGDIDVFANDEDDDYFSFMFVIRIFLPYIIYLEVFPLLLSAESEDTIFDPGISV
nr:hypothetical protein [Tanacetum cinerariifolium]